MSKYDGKPYSLVGQDGNAYFLMGYTAKAMEECGFSQAEIDQMVKEAKSSDYYHLVYVCGEYVEKCNDTFIDDDYEEEEEDW